MSKSFIAQSWFWRVVASDSVWSTARAAYVRGDDAALVEHTADGCNVPIVPNEAELVEILTRLGVADRAPGARPCPLSVELWQARAALDKAGLLAKVQAAIDASGNPVWRAAWEYSTDVSRDSELIVGLGAGLGLSPVQIDALFTSAASLTV